MSDYILKFVQDSDLEIYVLFYRKTTEPENLEYAIRADTLVDFLEDNNEKNIFVSEVKTHREKDPNPNFVTGIKQIDNSIIRIRR